MSTQDTNTNPPKREENTATLNGKVEYVSAGGPSYDNQFRFKIVGDSRIFSIAYGLTTGTGSTMANIICAGGQIDYTVSTDNGDLSIVNWVKTSFQD